MSFPTRASLALVTAAAASLGLSSSSASAHTPVGGLVIALSPDGKTAVAGGDNRVLYVLDAATLAVKERVWLKTSIWGLEFSKDGKRLVVEDTAPGLQILDTSTWKVEKALPAQGDTSYARGADRMAAIESASSGSVIRLLGMSDGAEHAAVKLEKGQKVAAFALNADASRLSVLIDLGKSEKEPAEKDAPKGLRGAALEDWKQKHDGKVSAHLLFEMPSGKKLSEHETFFTTSGETRGLFSGEAAMFVNYSNVNAKIAPDGATEVFQLESSYNYGIGFSADHKALAGGGLATATYAVVDGLKMAKVQVDKLPGWPEYFKGFAFHPDGTAFGTTSAYRVVKIKPDGKVEASAPVY